MNTIQGARCLAVSEENWRMWEYLTIIRDHLIKIPNEGLDRWMENGKLDKLMDEGMKWWIDDRWYDGCTNR